MEDHNSKDKIREKLEGICGKRNVARQKDLFIFNTLRVHARAEYFVEAKTRNELIELKKMTTNYAIRLRVLGAGSNLAILHRFLPGITVKNAYISKTIVDETQVYVDMSVSSGYPVGLLVKETTEAGYGGFEYHKGLPGTVGGALYMNSKWTHPETYFSEPLLYAYVVDDSGNVSKKEKSYFAYAYDYSILQKTHELLLEAVFRLTKTDKALLIKKADESSAYRRKTQPGGSGTTGCFFRNIPKKLQEEKKLPTNSAGYLIDQSGMKGYTIGDYYVSKQHANFVMNKGNGNPDDLKKILEIIKDAVKRKFGIELEEEVVLI